FCEESLTSQNPGVLAAAALRTVDHETASRQGDPRQPARQHLHPLAEQYEWPQVDVPAFEPTLDQRRVLTQRDRRLGDVAARVRRHLAGELRPLPRRRR